MASETADGGKSLSLFSRITARLKLYGELVMFSHTLFSLPFALASMLIAAGGFPGWRITFWIIMAFTGGRNAANALNRVIDRDIDAKNPRTAGRHLPAGKLRRREALGIAGAGFVLLAVSAWMLNPLCLQLLPLAVIIFVVYSYTKRFTWMCHIVLGAACAGASLGAWIAVTGRIEFNALVLTAANAAWVAGFDVIYAIQDIDFDRKEGLHSIPAHFGAVKARIGAAGMHGATVLLLVLCGLLEGLGTVYYAGTGLITALFLVEHLAVAPGRVAGNSGLINFAAYNMNQIIGLSMLVFTAVDILF